MQMQHSHIALLVQGSIHASCFAAKILHSNGFGCCAIGGFCMPAGDAIRYFILNSHGGVYMDMDVECFRPTDSFLRGYDLVLNVELGEGVTVTNAVMASAPNITYWRRVFAKMQVGLHCQTSVVT